MWIFKKRINTINTVDINEYKKAFVTSIKNSQLDYLLNKIVSFSVRDMEVYKLISIETHQPELLIGERGYLIGKIARNISKIVNEKIKIVVEPSKLWNL